MNAVQTPELVDLIASSPVKIQGRIHTAGMPGWHHYREMVGWSFPSVPDCLMFSRISGAYQDRWTISSLVIIPKSLIPSNCDFDAEIEPCFSGHTMYHETIQDYELVEFDVTLFKKPKQTGKEAILAEKQEIWSEAEEPLGLLRQWQNPHLSDEKLENAL